MSKAAPVTAAIDTHEWYDSPRQVALRALGIAVGAVLLLFICAIFVVPKAYGGTALTVMSGSMQPSLKPGDVIAVRGLETKDVCSQVGINEIVTYLPESGSSDLITHRVVSKQSGNYPDGTKCRLLTQGDNNNTPDALISPEQVRGKFMYGIPAVGWARDWVGQNRIIAIGIIAALVGAYYLWPSKQSGTQVLQLGGGGQLVLDGGSGGGTLLGGGAGGGALALPSAVGGSTTTSQPAAEKSSDPITTEFEIQVRELLLREREMRLREAEATREFGYVPPEPPEFVRI